MRYGELGNFYDGKHAFITYREKEGNKLVRGFINREGDIAIMFVEDNDANITASPRKGAWPLAGKIITQSVEYEIKLDVEPAQAGGHSGAGKYSENTKVDIYTVPSDKILYEFVGWRDNNDNGRIVATHIAHSINSLNKNEHFTALYNKLQTYEVTAVSNDEKLGTVSGGGTFVPGQKVKLEAVIVGDDDNIRFKGWFMGNSLIAFGSRYEFEMPADDLTIEGRFLIDSTPPFNKPYLALTSDCHSAKLAGHGFYDAGSQVPVSVSAPNRYKLEGWFEGDEKVSDTEQFTYPMPDYSVMLRARYSDKNSTDLEDREPEEPKLGDILFSRWYVSTYNFRDKQIPGHRDKEIKMNATGFLGFKSDAVKIGCPYPDDIKGVLYMDLGRERVEVSDGYILQQAGFYPWIIYDVTDTEIVMACGAYIFGLEMFNANEPLTHIHRVPYVVNKDRQGNISSIVISNFNPTLKADPPYADMIFYPTPVNDPMPVNWHLRPEITYGVSWIPEYEDEKAAIFDLIWRYIIPEVRGKLK